MRRVICAVCVVVCLSLCVGGALAEASREAAFVRLDAGGAQGDGAGFRALGHFSDQQTKWLHDAYASMFSEGFSVGGKGYTESNYTTLKRGSKGDLVKAAQERLIELDYLSGSADGSFGSKTENAVYLFQSTAQMERTGTLYYDTMVELMSSDAPRYVEDGCPAYFLNYAKWETSGKKNMLFKVQVHNASATRTVKSVMLVVQPSDGNGNNLGDVQYFIVKCNIKPGNSAYLPGVKLTGRSKIRKVECCIDHVDFSDGSIGYPENSRDYWSWDIEW